MRWLTPVSLLAATRVAANLVLSDVDTTYDASSGETYTISWEDDGKGTEVSVSDIQTVTLLLCTYGTDDTSIECLPAGSGLLSSYQVAGDTSASFSFKSTQASWGVDGTGYFFQLTAVVTASQYYQAYSDFITMEGMTGVVGTNVSPNKGPGTVPAGASDDSSGTNDEGFDPANFASLATVAYQSQTKYNSRAAPMQMQPGTKVTIAMSPSRRFPTSAVTYFKSAADPPSILTTYTISWSYTFTPYVNYAATQSGPSLVKDPTAVRQSYIAQVTQARARRRWQD